MKTHLAMVIDSSVCIDCKACMVACKVENKVPEGHWRNWIKEKPTAPDDIFGKQATQGMHFQPGNCMHCDNATCVQACPTGATYKDQNDGTVRVNKSLCIGCSSCIPACPYGARYRHPEKKVVDKCDFCESRRARGELPACVVTCPTKARKFGDLNDPVTDVGHLHKKQPTVRVTHAKVDTRPNLYYLSQTAPMDWPVAPKAPTPIQWLGASFGWIWGFVGLNALAVLGMLGKQLLFPDPPETENTQTETQQTEVASDNPTD